MNKLFINYLAVKRNPLPVCRQGILTLIKLSSQLMKLAISIFQFSDDEVAVQASDVAD